MRELLNTEFELATKELAAAIRIYQETPNEENQDLLFACQDRRDKAYKELLASFGL